MARVAFPGGMAHGCEAETSLLLHLTPALVNMSQGGSDHGRGTDQRTYLVGSDAGSGVLFQEFFSRNTPPACRAIPRGHGREGARTV